MSGAASEATAVPPSGPVAVETPARRAMRQFARRPAAVFGAAVLLLVLVLALFAPVLVAVVVGASVTLVLALGSWARRSRDGLARRRGLAAADRMTGEEFEDWLAILFRASGWRVRHTRATGDFGADLVLGHGAVDEVVVQAKRQGRPVGVAAVQQASAARLHYGVDRAMVVTNSTFTPAAIELAGSTGVELWDRDDVARELLGLGAADTSPRVSR